MTRTLLRGGTLYRDLYDIKPPGIALVLAPFVAVLGNTVSAVRVATIAINMLFVLVLTALAYRLTRSPAAALAAFVLALLYSAARFYIEEFFLKSTIPYLLPLLVFAVIGIVSLLIIRTHSALIGWCLLWIVLAMAGAFIGRGLRPAYFQEAVPPLIILIALCVPALARWHPATQVVLVIGALFSISVFVRQELDALEFWQEPQRPGGAGQAADQQEAAAFIREHSFICGRLHLDVGLVDLPELPFRPQALYQCGSGRLYDGCRRLSSGAQPRRVYDRANRTDSGAVRGQIRMGLFPGAGCVCRTLPEGFVVRKRPRRHLFR